MPSRFSLQISEDHLEVAGELPEDLAARAARRRRRLRRRDDGDATERAMAVRQRLVHGHALGADRQAVGGVLDVAAGDDRAVRRLERRAHLELRVVRARVVARFARGGDEIASVTFSFETECFSGGAGFGTVYIDDLALE